VQAGIGKLPKPLQPAAYVAAKQAPLTAAALSIAEAPVWAEKAYSYPERVAMGALEIGEIPAAQILRRTMEPDAPFQVWYTMDEFVKDRGMTGAKAAAWSVVLGIGLDVTTYFTGGVSAALKGVKGIKGLKIGGVLASEAGQKAFTKISQEVVEEGAQRGLKVASREVQEGLAEESIKRWHKLALADKNLTVPSKLRVGVPFSQKYSKGLTGKIPETPRTLDVTRRGATAWPDIQQRIGKELYEEVAPVVTTKPLALAPSKLTDEIVRSQRIAEAVRDVRVGVKAGTYTPIGAKTVEQQADLTEALDIIKNHNIDIFRPHEITADVPTRMLPSPDEVSRITRGMEFDLLDEAGDPVRHIVDDVTPEGVRTRKEALAAEIAKQQYEQLKSETRNLIDELGEASPETFESILAQITVLDKQAAATAREFFPERQLIPQPELLNRIYQGTKERVFRDTMDRVRRGATADIPQASTWQALAKMQDDAVKRQWILDLRARGKELDTSLKTEQSRLTKLQREHSQIQEALQPSTEVPTSTIAEQKQKVDRLYEIIENAGREGVSADEMKSLRAQLADAQTELSALRTVPEGSAVIRLGEITDEIARQETKVDGLEKELSALKSQHDELGRIPGEIKKDAMQKAMNTVQVSWDKMVEQELQRANILPKTISLAEGKIKKRMFTLTPEAETLLPEKRLKDAVLAETDRYVKQQFAIDETIGTASQPYKKSVIVGNAQLSMEKIGNKLDITVSTRRGRSKDFMKGETFPVILTNEQVVDIQTLFTGYHNLPQDAQNILLDMFKSKYPELDKPFLSILPEATDTKIAEISTIVERVQSFISTLKDPQPEQLERLTEIISEVLPEVK
jgi:hypothetical protein